MKRKLLVCALLVLALVCGLALAGCDGEVKDDELDLSILLNGDASLKEVAKGSTYVVSVLYKKKADPNAFGGGASDTVAADFTITSKGHAGGTAFSGNILNIAAGESVGSITVKAAINGTGSWSFSELEGKTLEKKFTIK
jgi:hypothetical protein